MDKNRIAWYRTNTEGTVELEGLRGKMVLEVWRIKREREAEESLPPKGACQSGLSE